MKNKALELIKKTAYRLPLLNFVSRPSYRYNIAPAQLSFLVNAISKTKNNKRPGVIVEIGVARGMTTCFLLEHMRTLGDKRTYFCIDTFSGFTANDIEYEVNFRSKPKNAYGGFMYNDKEIFASNIRKNGFDNFKVIQSDAGQFDFSTISPIDVLLLDVDLYIPTIAVLRNVKPFMNPNSFIMVDDCSDGDIYDGANQAYNEYISAHSLERIIVASGGVIINKASDPE